MKRLTTEDIHSFLFQASDREYLAIKTALVIGIAGLCRREELTNLTMNDLVDNGHTVIIPIPKTKTGTEKTFEIADEFYEIYKRYAVLRPKSVATSRFFLKYHEEKCSHQVIGINTFGSMPKIIATYVESPEPEKYTGHSFRRSSATMLADSRMDILTLKRAGKWKSTTTAEGYIDESAHFRKKLSQQIKKTIIPETPSTSSSITPTASPTGITYKAPAHDNFEVENECPSTSMEVNVDDEEEENADPNNILRPEVLDDLSRRRNITFNFTNCPNLAITINDNQRN